MPEKEGAVRRRAPRSLLGVTLALVGAIGAITLGSVAVPAPAAHAAHRDAPAGKPTVEVFASGGGVVRDGADVQVSVVIANPSTEAVPAGHVSVAVTTSAIPSTASLSDFTKSPGGRASRSLGSASTAAVPAGGSQVVARLTVPADTLNLPQSAPGVFGLSATVTTSDGPLGAGAGTLVVPDSTPTRVGVAAIMPITVPATGAGLISSTDLATYTASDGVLSRELTIAQQNPELTVGIDPMILVSIRALGQSAPASAREWLTSLADLGNPSFALQYGDADPVLQLQAGLSAPLQPSDFSYAMSPGDFNAPLTVGEPTSTPSPTPTPTSSPTTSTRLPSLAELVGFTYSLDGIAWPAAGTVRAADVEKLSAAKLTTTIVSSSNTNATSLSQTPGAALSTDHGDLLVTDDALSTALQAAATATDAADANVASAALNAQLALAAENASSGTVVLASLGRSLPTDTARATAALSSAFDSEFSHPATLDQAMSSTPTQGLALVDHQNTNDRLQSARDLLDLAGEHRAGGTPPSDNIATFASVLTTPALLTGDVRARLLDLFSVGWVGSDNWPAAVKKQIDSMHSTVAAVQIVSPGSIRQASRQALIPITVTNKLDHAVDVVLRATPSSYRLTVDSDTTKTIAPGSSAKVLVPVKSQLSNGTVYLGLQLFSSTGVAIGESRTAEIDVHADWEGVGALIFGIIVAGFFGFGLFRTIQRRRREKAEAEAGADAESDAAEAGDTPGGAPRG